MDINLMECYMRKSITKKFCHTRKHITQYVKQLTVAVCYMRLNNIPITSILLPVAVGMPAL